MPQQVNRERPGSGPVAGSSATPLPGANMRVFQWPSSGAKQLMPASKALSSSKFGRSAATSSADRRATYTWDGPRRYTSTGRSDSTPSTASNSSASSYSRQSNFGCVIHPNEIRAPSRSSRTGTVPDLVSRRISVN